MMRTSFDIPCSLWPPVVAMLELTGICLTFALPKVISRVSVAGILIVAVNSCGLSLKVHALVLGTSRCGVVLELHSFDVVNRHSPDCVREHLPEILQSAI